jgi:hypothetical protein
VRYYKATRPDGTDFNTGMVDYARALRDGAELFHPTRMVRNDPSTYFSVSIAPADCTGMRWPCRLFRVEPVGRVLRNDGLPNKRCCSRLRVIEELDPTLALGPDGAEVAALIERAKRLTYDEAQQLDAALGAAWGAARGAALGAARGAAWDAAWDAAWGAARGAAWDAAWDAARGATWGAAWDAALGAARGAAWDAAWGAAWGLVVRDLISEEHFDTLYGPWREVVGDA